MEEKKDIKLNLGGFTLSWGLITQCLVWSGVIDLPLLAIWGPFLIVLAVCVVIIVLAFFVGLIADAVGR